MKLSARIDMATPSLRIPKNKERITSYMNDYNFDSIVYDEPKYATVLFNSHAEIKSVILPSLLKSLFLKKNTSIQVILREILRNP